ncbi:hypothetical protein ACVQFT_001648, partial [Yersinia enterocolitica]
SLQNDGISYHFFSLYLSFCYTSPFRDKAFDFCRKKPTPCTSSNKKKIGSCHQVNLIKERQQRFLMQVERIQQWIAE